MHRKSVICLLAGVISNGAVMYSSDEAALFAEIRQFHSDQNALEEITGAATNSFPPAPVDRSKNDEEQHKQGQGTMEDVAAGRLPVALVIDGHRYAVLDIHKAYVQKKSGQGEDIVISGRMFYHKELRGFIIGTRYRDFTHVSDGTDVKIKIGPPYWRPAKKVWIPATIATVLVLFFVGAAQDGRAHN